MNNKSNKMNIKSKKTNNKSKTKKEKLHEILDIKRYLQNKRQLTALVVVALLVVLVLTVFIAMGFGANDSKTKANAIGDGQESDKNGASSNSLPMSILWRDNRLREAIALAIDKKALLDHSEVARATPIDFLVPMGIAKDDAGEDFRAVAPSGYHSYELAKAQALWKEATEALISDGVLEASAAGEPAIVKLKLLTFDAPQSRAIAENTKAQLERAFKGLTLEIEALPYEEKLQQEAKGAFDLDFTGWHPDYPDALSYLEIWSAGHKLNTTGYTSKAFDKALETAAAKVQITEMNSRIKQLQAAEAQLLKTDTALVPLYQRADSYLVKPEVKGLKFSPYGSTYSLAQVDTTALTEGIKQLRIMATTDLYTLDSTKIKSDQDQVVILNVMEGLVRQDSVKGNQVLPGVASSWKQSPDGLVYTFTLRPEAVWSSGEAVKAQDFVYAWQKQSQAINRLNLNVEATAIDNSTLQVKLQKPAPYFLQSLCDPVFYPQPQAFAERLAEKYGTTPDTALYNGPFMVTRWEAGYGSTLKPNPKYWLRAEVALEQVQYRLITDVDVAVDVYESMQLDVVALMGPLSKNYQGRQDFVQTPESTVYYFSFNLR